MSQQQELRFRYDSADQLRAFLRSLAPLAHLEERGKLFVFVHTAAPQFEFDCELLPGGLRVTRSGDYFEFAGKFLDALTGKFGTVHVKDS